MPFVAILGAGPLGGALAYALACRGRFDEVRLIDTDKTLAAGKALDILQSGPVDGYSTRVTGSASLDAADGAWVTLLADPVTPAPLEHIGLLQKRSPGAVLVCADARHALPLTRAVATGAVPPDRVVGAAPAAVASGARALLALDADVSPSLVQVGITHGAPPGLCRIDWTHTAIDGVAASTCLRREQQDRLDARLDALWPPGPLTLAAAAARIAEAAWFGARSSFPCWWVTDGGAGSPTVRSLRFAPGGRARVTG
jgi:malate dehydrogenase